MEVTGGTAMELAKGAPAIYLRKGVPCVGGVKIKGVLGAGAVRDPPCGNASEVAEGDPIIELAMGARGAGTVKLPGSAEGMPKGKAAGGGTAIAIVPCVELPEGGASSKLSPSASEEPSSGNVSGSNVAPRRNARGSRVGDGRSICHVSRNMNASAITGIR